MLKFKNIYVPWTTNNNSLTSVFNSENYLLITELCNLGTFCWTNLFVQKKKKRHWIRRSDYVNLGVACK